MRARWEGSHELCPSDDAADVTRAGRNPQPRCCIANYISCGWKVKSEIVIPIMVRGENIGQIDIDSHTSNPFTDADEELLEFICNNIASLY